MEQLHPIYEIARLREMGENTQRRPTDPAMRLADGQIP